MSAVAPAAAQVPTEDELWGLRMIRLDRAIERGLTGRGTVIGVVDSAMQLDHPEYAGRLRPSFDIYDQGPSTRTPEDHGTHVAGTIAGSNVGVARGATLVPITILVNNQSQPGFDTLLASGYRHGLQQGVRIFNNSWGTIFQDVDGNRFGAITDFDMPFLQAALQGQLSAFQEVARAGGIMVFAAGNLGGSQPSIQAGLPVYFPELTPYWVAVTSLGEDGLRASYAQACGVAAQWCLAAPGGDADDTGIMSSVPGSDYGRLFGTSMAAPHVSGALAIAAELYPHASSAELVQLVLQTAQDIGAPGVDDIYGWGRLDIGNIVDTLDPRMAGSFATASFSRTAALAHVGSVLRQQTDLRGGNGSGTGGGLGGAAFDAYMSFSASMDGGRLGLADPGLRGIWVTPVYGETRLSSAGAARGVDSKTAGVLAGADLLSDERLRLGIAAGWSRTDASTAGSPDKATTDAMHVGVYGAVESDGWFLKGSAHAAFFEAPPGGASVTRRDIAGAAGTSGAPVGRAAIRGTGFEADARFGHAFEIAGGASLAPYVSARSRWQRTQAARETGAGIFALDIGATNRSQTEVGPGIRLVSAPLALQGVTLRFAADIGYARLIGDVSHDARVVLLGQPLEARTAAVGRDILRVGTRIDVARADERLSSFIAYDAAIQRNAVSHSVSGGITKPF